MVDYYKVPMVIILLLIFLGMRAGKMFLSYPHLRVEVSSFFSSFGLRSFAGCLPLSLSDATEDAKTYFVGKSHKYHSSFIQKWQHILEEPVKYFEHVHHH